MLKTESRENRGEKIKEKDIVSSKSLPYPPIKKNFLYEGRYKKFLTLFNSFQVAIPFSNALQQILTYANILKELQTKKIKFSNKETVNISELHSAIIRRKYPSKQSDPKTSTYMHVK